MSCDLFIYSHCRLALYSRELVALVSWDILKSSTLVSQIDKSLEILEEFRSEELVA